MCLRLSHTNYELLFYSFNKPHSPLECCTVPKNVCMAFSTLFTRKKLGFKNNWYVLGIRIFISTPAHTRQSWVFYVYCKLASQQTLILIKDWYPPQLFLPPRMPCKKTTMFCPRYNSTSPVNQKFRVINYNHMKRKYPKQQHWYKTKKNMHATQRTDPLLQMEWNS